MKKLFVALLVLGMVVVASNSYASITIYADQAAAQAASQLGQGDFEAVLTWNQGLSQLNITLDNTTAGAIGGVITRFAFNLPNTLGAANSLTLNFHDAGYASLLIGSNESPFGDFDYGVDLRKTPTYHGIAISDPVRSFTFDVSLDSGEVLTELDFINEFSDNGKKEGEFFLVRFQELANEGSDKVPGKTGDNPVPEPATMLLFGPAMFGLFGMKKKK